MEIHCKIDRSELSEGVRRIRQSLGRVRKNSSKFQLELEFKTDRLYLRVPGALIELEAKSTGAGRFKFPF